jgi:hypothetical protein
MKTFLIGLFFTLMFATSCIEQNVLFPINDYQSKGLITGGDPRDCACCGGWIIEIDTARYRFNSLPDSCGVNLEKEIFPLKVKLDWKKADHICLGDEIIITKIKKIQ